jgi:hypothetical protein
MNTLQSKSTAKLNGLKTLREIDTGGPPACIRTAPMSGHDKRTPVGVAGTLPVSSLTTMRY